MDFATNFNRICKEKGTSPTALVKALGVSTSKVNLWNNGSLPKQEMLIRLAQELGCSVMDFFADEDEIIAKQTAEPKDEDENDIIRVYRMLDRRAKHEFMSMVYEYEKQAEYQGDRERNSTTV